jgi:hypothetical protein
MSASLPNPSRQDLLLIHIDSVGPHERQLKRDRLQMQSFKEDVGLAGRDVGLLNILRVFNQDTTILAQGPHTYR